MPDNWTLPNQHVKLFQFQVAIEDVDRDRDYDIAVATYDVTPYLLCMEDGKYINRSNEIGLSTWDPSDANMSAMVRWIDFNIDGYS